MLNSTVELRLDVKKILRAEYHRLGIFLDSRCDHSRYRRILIDVSNLSFEILKHHNIDVCNNDNNVVTFSILSCLFIFFIYIIFILKLCIRYISFSKYNSHY